MVPSSVTKPFIDHALFRSFGRVKGRVLGGEHQDLVDELLPTLIIDDLNKPIAAYFAKSYEEYQIEIGFGGGEHLVHLAEKYPHIAFVGCEPYLNGVALLLKQIKEKQLANIRIFRGDARILLQQLDKPLFHKLYILFPDPWPKKKHHKKRLISAHMPAQIANILVDNGRVLIATDHSDYAGWILSFMLRESRLTWLASHKGDWQSPPADWVQTRYQQKALKEGREAVFFTFEKHIK